MECPNCKHATSDTALLQCSHCGESFERGPLEEYRHLAYLADWLSNRPEITQKLKSELLALVGKKQDLLLGQLLPKIVEEPEPEPIIEVNPPEEITEELSLIPTELVVVPDSVADAVRPQITTEIRTLEAAESTTTTPLPVPKAPPAKPIAPPKPKRPPIDWRKVITEAATSGALLRALLYLGAFMIVVSAAVLVIRFWNQFNPVLQLLFIASVPLTFYMGGWALRTRLRLTQAGTVLTGIGAILVAVDFAAIFQLSGIGRSNGSLYWLIVTIFCTALYAFTAWRLQGEFFDYLTLLGGASVLFTFTRLLRLPTEWSVVSVTLSGTLMTLVASRFSRAGDSWHEFARAARYLAQILIPASVFYVMFSPAKPPIGHMLGFLFATMGYYVLAWQFPTLVFAYAALGASIGAVVFGLRVADFPLEWYATVGSVLGLTYIFLGRRVQRAKIEPKIVLNYVKSLNTTGFILIALAVLGGFIFTLTDEVWAGVAAMALASLDLAICSYLFKRARYTLVASGLFIIPFSMAIMEWLSVLQVPTTQVISWFSFAWSALAMIYIGLGGILQKAEAYSKWLHAWAHLLTIIALMILPFAYVLDSPHWTKAPTLISLGVSILVYLLSFILQDSGRHTSLSTISNWLPYGLGKALFLWPVVFLLPIWVSVAWNGNERLSPWLGVTLAVFGLAYIGTGQWLFKRAKEYRLPFHVFTYLLCVVGILVAAPDIYSFFTALLIAVISAGMLAFIYDRVVETVVASLLFVWPFQVLMEILSISYYAQTLGFAVLACLAYIPVAIYLNKFQKSRERFHHAPVFSVGYALIIYAVGESIISRGNASYIPWVGVTVPLLATALLVFSTSYFQAAKYARAWPWAAALTFAVAFGQTLTLFGVPTVYDALAWTILAAFYVMLERILFFTSQRESRQVQRFWSGMFHQPLSIFALGVAALGLLLSLPSTFTAFTGIQQKDYLPPILAQMTLVGLAIASAWSYRQRWPFFTEPFIAFLPVTVFFVGYGKQIFGQPLTTPQYALTWTALGAMHMIAGMFIDRAKVRYAHGLYLGGYVLLSWAVLWSFIERSSLVWTLGVWISASFLSALLVHFRRHQTWEDFIYLIFGTAESSLRSTIHNAFQWLAAWTFPIWCVIFLRETHVSDALSWLGLVIPPLAYLGLALWFRRVDETYMPPLFSAAQFYTAVALLISTPATIEFLFRNLDGDKNTFVAFMLLQVFAVFFYAGSAWIFKRRGFAHVTAWLSIIAFTMAWKLFGPTFTSIRFVIPWLMWSTVLLIIGFVLDKNKVRYSHASYLAGYILASYALARSTPDRLTNIYALAITISLALISYILVHFGRHHSYEYFIGRFWEKADATTRQIASTFFLFFAAYALPVLLTQILAYIEYPLAWRGVTLALLAPLYIAAGLLVSHSKSRSLQTVPAWALYSAGYALTALGAMVAFEDERLATYVLVLNTIVYAVSAYIFQQSFWLYLSTILTPIIALLVLHQTNHFESAWLAWIFIALAFVYLALGQLLEQLRSGRSLAPASADTDPFAAPFYFPGFLLSAVALAIASNERTLAIQIYSTGVVFYALSGFLLREVLFIYPAAWLTAVPYFLTVTLTSLETRWYGLAWLPLILVYIVIGRVFFHKQPLAPLGKGVLGQWITHPAIPFYLLAYALSVSMISLSYIDPLAITLAFGIAALLYFSTAFLFRTPAWIYPSLFAAHMTLLTYFTINPKGGEAYLLSLPFHALTWVMALLGYGFSRRNAEAVSAGGESFKPTLLERLVGHPWSRPFFIFTVMDIILWQCIALKGDGTTITLSIGHALLLALFSLLWEESGLVYGAIGFAWLAVGGSLKQAQVPFADAVAVFGGIGFGLYLLGRVLEVISARLKSLAIWPAPLTHSSVVLTAIAVIINLPFVTKHPTATAETLAFAGALYVTIAYRGRQYALGYAGMAMLEVAWAILLFMNDISQPQFYAIPAGLYFMAMGYLELRRNRKRYGVAVDILGLSVLMVTSFAQSLNGAHGFPYFVLLLFEGLLVIWWGVLQKRKMPFFAGIAASALNILAQVIVLISVYDINRWLVAFAVGLLIMGIAIYIERGREQLRAYSREWSETLETWE